jgi:penicillin-binding protein 1A
MWKKISLWLLALMLLVVIGIFIFIGAVRTGVFGCLPRESELLNLEANTAAKILASDGELLGLYYLQNRTHSDLSDLPGYLIDALIATEDARFYNHKGIDMRSSVRALVMTVILQQRRYGGGSTISQQLAKNLFPRKDFGILTMPVAKVKEMLIAMRLESIYTKGQLLELYFNTVSFGENTYGIETASLVFFSKPPGELSMEESAILIGLLKAPTTYNPRLNPEISRERRNIVIGQMCKYGYINEREKDSLQAIPLTLLYNPLNSTSGLASYFREHIRLQAREILKEINRKTGTEYNLYTSGLVVRTTLDANMQRYAETSAREHVSALQKLLDKEWKGREPWRRDLSLAELQVSQSEPYKRFREKGMNHTEAIKAMRIPHPSRIFTWNGIRDTVLSSLDSVLYHFGLLQCGVVAIEPASGAVRVWVGGDDYGFFQYDHVTGHRQAGSAFKPIVYAAALEQGIDPCRLYPAETEVYRQYQDWSPRNHDENYEGYYSMQGALVQSVNTVSVKVLMDAGIPETAEMAARLGITTDQPLLPSMALGTGEVTLLELAVAYGVFLEEGIKTEPYVIEEIRNREGAVIYRHDNGAEPVRVMASSTASTMTGMMQAVVERGTASTLQSRYQLHNALAGKTGTTQSMTDGWFIGMTPVLVIGVWVGGDSPLVRFQNSNLGYGSNSALPVFAGIVTRINSDRELRGYVAGDFNLPEDIALALSCEDFTLRKGLRQNARHYEPQPIQRPSAPQKTEKENESGARKFFKKVFGKKDRR